MEGTREVGPIASDIPATPWRVYRDKGWTTIGDWLGKGERHSKNRQWRPFAEARDYARALGLRNGAEWSAHCKSGNLPPDIPADPAKVYKGLGWHIAWRLVRHRHGRIY